MGIQISAAMHKKVRDYVVEEPSYTVAFAAWELGISRGVVDAATARLLETGVIKQIEERKGPYAAVYQYDPPKPARHIGPVASTGSHFPELDESRRIGELAPARGVVVPHTRVRGRSGKPGKDAQRQAAGVRIKKRTA